MARRVKNYTVSREGRDKGKTFRITEMPATQAERWATRAVMAMMKENVQIQQGFETLGMAGVAALGLQSLALIPFDIADTLLEEMFQCITFVADLRTDYTRPLVEDDIEEVTTRLELRGEVIELHTGFSIAARLRELEARAATNSLDQNSLNTPTSPAPSA